MTTRPELVLYSSLTDIDRLEYIATEGIDPEVIPTAVMRPVVEWAIKYYFDSGCKQAPSREALTLEWGEILELAEIELDDPDDEIETAQWALEYLKSTFLNLRWQEWSKKAATEMASAYTGDRIEVFAQHASELGSLAMQVRSTADEASGLRGIESALRRYHERVARDGAPEGLMFGLTHLDEHTNGIHVGELAVLAAGPKTGKSWMLAYAALCEWLRGRRALLYTLENSVDMTWDRIVCMHARVAFRRWQRGQCEPEELLRVESSRAFMEQATAELGGDLIVRMPPKGQRTVESLVRESQMRGAESLLIDQLTFVEATSFKGKARWEIVRDIIHDLKLAISSGSYKVPCLLAHQINRDGVKAADKTGYLEMYMLAESSEVERTADWVFGLYRGQEDRMADAAKLQVLASRREDVLAWMLAYDPSVGLMSTIGETILRGDE